MAWAERIEFDDVLLVTNDEEHPSELCCPISHSLMNEPVILISDCHTYERSQLRQWLKNSDLSPITKQKLTSKQFIPNLAIQKQIDSYNRKKSEIKQQKFQRAFRSITSHLNKSNCVKLLIVGDCNVGKTSLKKYIEFNHGDIQYTQPTIGVETSFVKFAHEQDHKTKEDIAVRITDICGMHDRYRSVTRQCYRGIHGAVLVCSLDNIDSVKNLKHQWNDDIYEHAPDNVHGIVVINKCDLLQSSSIKDELYQEKVNQYEKVMRSAIKFANYAGYPVYCCSCITGEYIHAAFKELTLRIIRDHDIWNDIQYHKSINIKNETIDVQQRLMLEDVTPFSSEGCITALKKVAIFANDYYEKLKTKM